MQVINERPPTTTPTTPPNALGLPLRIALDEFSVGQFDYADYRDVVGAVTVRLTGLDGTGPGSATGGDAGTDTLIFVVDLLLVS